MKKIHISPVDTIFANGSYPIEFLIFYKNKLKSKYIRSALKNVSSLFWPIFGEYDSGYIEYDRYEENEYFDEEIINNNFDTKELNHNISNYLLPEIKKLFFLKIIQYQNGTVLIPKMNHLAGDGYSYFYFLSVLAAISHKTYIPFKRQLIKILAKPTHKRTALKPFKLDNINFESLPVEDNLTIKIEEVSRKSTKNVIKEISSKSDQKVSANDILSAMVVKKKIEIKNKDFGENFILSFPMDVRRQIKEYGPKYFGNGLMSHHTKFKIQEIQESNIQDLAIKIRQNMPTVSKENYLKFLNNLEILIANKQVDQLRPYDPEAGCLVTNLSKMPTTELDFGTGNPDLILPITIGKNSAAILANSENYILRLVY